MSRLIANAATNALQATGEASSEAFTRNQRVGLVVTAAVAYGLTALLAGPIGFFAERDFGASLALDPFASSALIKAALWTLLVGLGATFVVRSIRPDIGLFAAGFALMAIRRVGGTARDVYLQHPSPAAIRGLAMELVMLGLVLAAIQAVSRILVHRGMLPDDEAHDHIRPKPELLGQKLIATAACALTVGLVVLLLCRSDERMQVTVALALGGLLASVCAVRFIPAEPSAWYWTGSIAIGVVGYLLASFVPAVIGEPGGYAPALARAMPLDYASAGVIGAVYGYWIGRPMMPEDSLMPMTRQELAEAKVQNEAAIDKMAAES